MFSSQQHVIGISKANQHGPIEVLQICNRSFFFFLFPAMSLGFCTLGEMFAHVTCFNPTIEIVTFRLCGWCFLGAFVASIYPSKTRISESFESVRWSACAHRLDLGLYSHQKEGFLGNGVRTHVNSKGKISTGKILLRRGSNPQRCIKQDSEPNTLPTNYSRRLQKFQIKVVISANHNMVTPGQSARALPQ